MSEEEAQELEARIVAAARLTPARSLHPPAKSIRTGSRLYGCGRWGKWPRTEFIRLGPLFFLDDSLHGSLTPMLQGVLGENALRVSALNDSILAGSLGDFTLAAAAVILGSDVYGRRIVDAGAGDGMLSLVALKLGAASSEMIDVDRGALGRAKINLRLNAFLEQKQFSLINADLSDPVCVAGRLKRSTLSTVVVSNIGGWDYGVDNADSMLLLVLIPAASLFIGAGYSTRAFLGLRHLKNDEDLLGLLGFAGADRATLEKGRAIYWPFPETIVATSAARFSSLAESPDRSEILKRFAERRKAGAYRLHGLFRAVAPYLVFALALFMLYALYRIF